MDSLAFADTLLSDEDRNLSAFQALFGTFPLMCFLGISYLICVCTYLLCKMYYCTIPYRVCDLFIDYISIHWFLLEFIIFYICFFPVLYIYKYINPDYRSHDVYICFEKVISDNYCLFYVCYSFILLLFPYYIIFSHYFENFNYYYYLLPIFLLFYLHYYLYDLIDVYVVRHTKRIDLDAERSRFSSIKQEHKQLLEKQRFEAILAERLQSQSLPANITIKSLTPIIDVVLNVYALYTSFTNARNKKQRILAVTAFVRAYYSLNDVEEVLQTVFNFINSSNISFDDDCITEFDASDYQDSDNLESQSLARDFLDNWKQLSQSQILNKMQRVVFCLISAGLVKEFDLPFSASGLTSFHKKNLKTFSFTSLNDMCYSVLDCIVSFTECGYQCFLNKSLRPIIARNQEVCDFLEKNDNLIKEVINLPSTLNPNYPDILSKMDVLIDTGRSLIGVDDNRVIMNSCLAKLISIRAKFIRENNVSSYRRPPFSILLHGPPSIGKSMVMSAMANLYQKVVVRENIYPDLVYNHRECMYTYNPGDDYMSGFAGAKHWFIAIDDIAREHVSIIKAGKTTSISSIIDMVNTVGIASVQAGIDDKGAIPLVPKLVIATTNQKNLNAYAAMNDPSAVLRRLPHVIKPVVKPQFRKNGTHQIQQLSSVEKDAWLYEIETVKISSSEVSGVPVNRTEYIPYVPPGKSAPKDGTIYQCTGAEMNAYLSSAIIKHESASSAMETAMNEATDSSLCVHGVLSDYSCEQCDSSLVSQNGIWFMLLAFLVPQFLIPPLMPIYYKMFDFCYALFDSFIRHNKNYFRFLFWMLPFWARHSVIAWLYTFNLISATQFLMCVKYNGTLSLPIKVQQAKVVFGAVASMATSYLVANYIMSFYDGGSKDDDDDVIGNSGVWNTTSFNSDFSVPKCAKKHGLGELLNTVGRSVFPLAVTGDDGIVNTINCVGLLPEQYLTVGHMFSRGDTWTCHWRIGGNSGNTVRSGSFILTSSDITRYDNDLIVFRTQNILPRRSLYSYLPQSIDRAPRKCTIVDVSRNCEISLGEFSGLRYGPEQYTNMIDGKTISGDFMRGIRGDRRPKAGDCGSIIISETSDGKYYISGIHVAGSKTTSTMLVSNISKNLLSLSVANTDLLEAEKDIPLYAQGSKKSGELGSLASKNITMWANQGTSCDALGSFPARSSHSSRTSTTEIADDILLALGQPLLYGAPIMRPGIYDGAWLNPYCLAMNDQGAPNNKIPPQALKLATDAFIYDGIATPEIWLQNTPTVSTSVAINGVAGDRYMNSLCMSTSGGFYFPGAKKQYFVGEVGSLSMGPDLLIHYNALRNSYLSGHRHCSVFQASLKDEPIKLSKIASGKTRVFTASDLSLTILAREQFLGITKDIMCNNFISEAAVSMNCYSSIWGDLKKYLCKHGKNRLIAGDYKAFDKTMPSCVIASAFRVLIEWRCSSSNSNLTNEDILIMRGIMTDISYPVTNINGDLVQFFGGNSSGHPLTTIINCIANSIYVRMTYYMLGYDLGTFKTNVSLITYGDDNVMGSNHNGFNHTTISTTLARMGITYTMADKTSESIPFLHISKIDFLKRRFVDYNDIVIAPLEFNSIIKSLVMMVHTDSISEPERNAQAYLSARRELSLHGRKVFNKYTQLLDSIFVKYPLMTKFFFSKHRMTFDETFAWVTGPNSFDCVEEDIPYTQFIMDV